MNDPEIRALLRPLLLGGIQIEELVCGSTRADIVHVHPDHMHGYELKGSGDNLLRAENQLFCYSRVYDFVSFVVTDCHLRALLKILPPWVGIMVAEPDGITPYRLAKPNPQQKRPHVIGLLRQPEVKLFLKKHGETGLSKKRDWELFDALNKAEHITLSEVGAYVRERLTSRLPERLKRRENLRVARQGNRLLEEEQRGKAAALLHRLTVDFLGQQVEGFLGYRFDEDSGQLWHLPGLDKSGHRRARRKIARQRKAGGSEGYQLRRNGCPVWVSVEALRRLMAT